LCCSIGKENNHKKFQTAISIQALGMQGGNITFSWRPLARHKTGFFYFGVFLFFSTLRGLSFIIIIITISIVFIVNFIITNNNNNNNIGINNNNKKTL
jgi:hypothetical protein